MRPPSHQFICQSWTVQKNACLETRMGTADRGRGHEKRRKRDGIHSECKIVTTCGNHENRNPMAIAVWDKIDRSAL